jgi:hypothetical protein
MSVEGRLSIGWLATEKSHNNSSQVAQEGIEEEDETISL